MVIFQYFGSELHSVIDQLIDELTKFDLQVFNSDKQFIKINYSKLVGKFIGHHLQVWGIASISLIYLLKDAAVLLSKLFISDMPAKNLFEVSEIDTMYKCKNNMIDEQYRVRLTFWSRSRK